MRNGAAWSTRVWREIVWPALADQFPDYRYVTIEDRADPLARMLDADGGTDAYLVRPGHPPIGLAQRAQAIAPTATPYNTFSIRVALPSNLPTEIHKSWEARCDPVLYRAQLTGQAYLRERTEELLSAAIAVSTAIFDAVQTRVRRIYTNPDDGNLFTAVPWKQVTLRASVDDRLRLF